MNPPISKCTLQKSHLFLFNEPLTIPFFWNLHTKVFEAKCCISDFWQFFGHRLCKQSRIYSLIFMYIVKSSGGRLVSTLASYARGLGFKPRAGHVFLFLSNYKKSDKYLATGKVNKHEICRLWVQVLYQQGLIYLHSILKMCHDQHSNFLRKSWNYNTRKRFFSNLQIHSFLAYFTWIGVWKLGR